MKIGIIGAGHAGVEAARNAVDRGAEVILYSADSTLPYFRPRIVGVAFGQTAPDAIFMHQASWYEGLGITLKLNTKITSINPETFEVEFEGGKQKHDALIIATGAGPVLPSLTKGAVKRLLPLWTLEDAKKILELRQDYKTLAVLGGGLIGIEIALRAADSGLQVTVIEKKSHLLHSILGRNGGFFVQKLLEEKGIQTVLGRKVDSVNEGNVLRILLDDGKTIDADAGVLCFGVAYDNSLAQSAGLKVDKGICVTTDLMTSTQGIFACGDAVEIAGRVHCSVPDALAQGRIAGRNASKNADTPTEQLVWLDVPTSFKYGDFEIRAAGVRAEGESEQILSDPVKKPSYRAVTMNGDVLQGVQMVGDCSGFELWRKQLMEAKK